MISFIKRKKVLLSVILIIIVIAAFALSAGGKNGSETVLVSRADLVRTVELAGKVVPMEDADLSFEVGGTVSAVFKKVGDYIGKGETIVSLDSSATRADLLKAEADLVAAEAELAKLSGGADLSAKVTNSKTSSAQDIVDAYTKADDAVYNKVDQFFENPRTPNPKIVSSFDDVFLRDRINGERVVIGTVLANWKARVVTLSAATYTSTDLENAQSYLKTIALFLDDVGRAVNSFKEVNSLTQTMIDKYKTDVATARQNVNMAAATLISGAESLSDTVSDVPVQSARVASARATVANYRSRLSKMTLQSPISGIVSKQDAKIGEAISANTNIVSIISADYKIEAYVPEVSIAGVMVGAKALVTLDAYGKDVSFDAAIVRIEPRETVRDGVSTYKIELLFNKADERVRSGMTSNISIETLRKAQVLLIPSRAIASKNKVSVKNEDGGTVAKQIEVGLTDSNGNIEVVSGLTEGEAVFLNPEN